MTPEALAAALRLLLPNTEIVLGDKPGRIVVKMAPSPYALTIHIALSKSGDRAEVSDADPAQRPRDRETPFPFTVDAALEKIVSLVNTATAPKVRTWFANPDAVPRIRAWAHLPDVLPMIRPKADALLAADRKAAAKVREDLRLHEEDIAALERALGMTP